MNSVAEKSTAYPGRIRFNETISFSFLGLGMLTGLREGSFRAHSRPRQNSRDRSVTDFTPCLFSRHSPRVRARSLPSLARSLATATRRSTSPPAARRPNLRAQVFVRPLSRTSPILSQATGANQVCAPRLAPPCSEKPGTRTLT